MAPRSTSRRKRTWGRWLILTGGLAVLVAGLVLSAPAAFTAGTPTGHEQIIRPVPVPVGVLVGTQAWMPPVDTNANPIDGIAADTVTGTGYDQGGQVFGMVCNGNPPTATGWNVATDCDSLTASTEISVGIGGNPSGTVTLDFNVPSEIGVFRGVGPNDQFNCLAPADNPNGTTVNVPNLPTGGTPASIDRTVPSWGSTLPLVAGVGGGTAPCTIRIGYQSVNLSTTSDKFFPLALPQEASNVPPPARSLTTVPNPNIPITAPAGLPPTTSAPPGNSLTGRSATSLVANPGSPTTSTSTSTSTRARESGETGTGSGVGHPCSPTTASTANTSTTLCTSSTQAVSGTVSAQGAASPDSTRGGQATESVSSPTTVQLVAAATSAGTTNSQAYWYLLAGAGVCAVGVGAAELRDSAAGSESLAVRGVSGRSNDP